MCFLSATLLSIFNYLVGQYALCSNSTDKCHAFPNISLNGDIPRGVLNAVLSHPVLYGIMVDVHYYLVTNEVWSKLVKCKHNFQKLFFSCASIKVCLA